MITKKEAHNKVKEWIAKNDSLKTQERNINKMGKWHFGKIELHQVIDEIFKDTNDTNK